MQNCFFLSHFVIFLFSLIIKLKPIVEEFSNHGLFICTKQDILSTTAALRQEKKFIWTFWQPPLCQSRGFCIASTSAGHGGSWGGFTIKICKHLRGLLWHHLYTSIRYLWNLVLQSLLLQLSPTIPTLSHLPHLKYSRLSYVQPSLKKKTYFQTPSGLSSSANQPSISARNLLKVHDQDYLFHVM